MTNSEWVALIATIIGGFFTLTVALITGACKISASLSELRIALEKKVSYTDCSENRKECPCIKEYHDFRTKTHLGE